VCRVRRERGTLRPQARRLRHKAMVLTDVQTPKCDTLWSALVTESQMRLFAELIYRRTGIRVLPQKRLLLSNRLRRRLRATRIGSFGEYYRYLRRLGDDDPEWDAFCQEITTHETYLFRDEPQWRWIREVFLAERAEAARRGKGPQSLRIWSAACSTGDEPLSAACCIAACLPNFRRWRIEILGTDIGRGSLRQAEAAAFNERAMRLVPESYRRRFFAKAAGAAIWRARPILTDMLAFRRHNLMEPIDERPFDLAILRNVLIYFDAASKAAVVGNVRAALRPGGILMLGATEGVADMVRDFQRLDAGLYRKPIP
jgi:chemotaxis protein methyltransferase CheR